MEQEQNNSIISDFRLSEGNSKTSSSNSKKSKILNYSSISDIENLREEFYTIKELEQKAKEKNVEEGLNFYDLDEKRNIEYISQFLEKKDKEYKEKIVEFNNIQYKLTYEDRIHLLKKYEDLFNNDQIQKEKSCVIIRQNERLKEIFISIIKDILKYKPIEILELFHTKYYVETQTSNIPFINGGEEFIFANLINDIYDTFILKSNYKNYIIDKAYDDSKYLSNIIKGNIPKPVIDPILITNEKSCINNNDIKMENNFTQKNENNSFNFNRQKFVSTRYILSPILKKYSSEEFQKKHEEFLKFNPEFNNDKRVKYIYEIILESLFYYYIYINEKNKGKIISDYAEKFYEVEQDKLLFLNNSNIVTIKDENGNDIIYFDKLENKDYDIYIDKINFKFNFYDYIINKLFDQINEVTSIKEMDKKKEFIENKLNDCDFWTIQKHAKINSPYLKKNLKEKFDQEVITMLKHNVLKNTFNEINIFEAYKYPFLKEGFINQVQNSIIYIPMPSQIILGLTIKKMGIIIINKGRHDKIINEQKNKNQKYILKLGEFSFYKITLLHEINFHYFLVILYSNDKNKALITPERVFKNYKVENKGKILDFGDKGEVLLFGTKIDALYIRAMINIINLKLWDENIDIKPKKIGEKFMEINNEVKDSDIILKQLIDLSGFTEELYKIINNEKNTKEFKESENIGNIFARGKIINIDINHFDFDGDFGKILPRGECLNSYIH